MSTVTDNTKLVNLTQSSIVYTKLYKVGSYDSVCYQLHYTDATPAAAAFIASGVDATADTITTTAAHGFNTGLKVALTGTNLPGGLSATNYWVIVVSTTKISLASSLANAVAGTVVDITSQGTTANAALTPAALVTTGVVVKLQQSNDGVTFFDVSGVTVTITAASDTLWLVTNPPALWHKFVVTPSTGALSLWIMTCSRNNTVFSSGGF